MPDQALLRSADNISSSITNCLTRGESYKTAGMPDEGPLGLLVQAFHGAVPQVKKKTFFSSG